jgi:hypothetical protein
VLQPSRDATSLHFRDKIDDLRLLSREIQAVDHVVNDRLDLAVELE